MAMPDRVMQLAHQIPALVDRCRRMEEAGGGIVLGTASAELKAVEDYILSIPATSLAGAAVQIMLAYSLNDQMSDGRERGGDLHRQVERALRSALKQVAQAAGLDLSTVAGDHYAAHHTDPFPIEVQATELA